MAATSHPRSYRLRKTDRAGSILRFRRGDHLQNICPVNIHISIRSLAVVRYLWPHDEAVVGVNISRLVQGMMT